MKKFLAATCVFFAFPAAASAQPATVDGFKLRGTLMVEAGEDIGGNATFGAAIGYDFPVGGAILGIEIGGTGQPYVAARAGAPIGERSLIFAKVGYAAPEVTFRDLNGNITDQENVSALLVGAGVEVGLSRRFFLTGEYNYTNLAFGLERHQAIAGVGLRF